jgi:hypothetical protein
MANKEVCKNCIGKSKSLGWDFLDDFDFDSGYIFCPQDKRPNSNELNLYNEVKKQIPFDCPYKDQHI